jgi:hypothetical protein
MTYTGTMKQLGSLLYEGVRVIRECGTEGVLVGIGDYPHFLSNERDFNGHIGVVKPKEYGMKYSWSLEKESKTRFTLKIRPMHPAFLAKLPPNTAK